MIIILCRCMQGRAPKEKRPLSLGNVLEQMRTLTCQRTRGFVQMQWMAVSGAAVHSCTVCALCEGTWAVAGGTGTKIQALPLAMPRRGKGILQGHLPPSQHAPTPEAVAAQRGSLSHLQAPWPGAYPCRLWTGVGQRGGVRGENGLTGRPWDGAHQEWGTRGIAAESEASSHSALKTPGQKHYSNVKDRKTLWKGWVTW